MPGGVGGQRRKPLPTRLANSKPQKQSPVGATVWVCRACSKANGYVKRIHKSPGNPDDGNPIAKGKGVLSDQKSEGSLRQRFDVTNRNRIQGLFFLG